MIGRLLIRLGLALVRLRCGWRGHRDLRHVDRITRTVVLACEACGRETRGWDLVAPAPRPLLAADRHRLRLPRTAAVYRGREVVHTPLRRRANGPIGLVSVDGDVARMWASPDARRKESTHG